VQNLNPKFVVYVRLHQNNKSDKFSNFETMHFSLYISKHLSLLLRPGFNVSFSKKYSLLTEIQEFKKFVVYVRLHQNNKSDKFLNFELCTFTVHIHAFVIIVEARV
jgi:hypothetical protein